MTRCSKVCLPEVLQLLILTTSSVPSLPSRHARQRGEETPSHPGGLSDTARQRLEDYRRNREKQRGVSYTRFHFLLFLYHFIDGITIVAERQENGPKGLGDFQRRLNRDGRYDKGRRDYNGRDRRDYNDRDRQDYRDNRSWDATPKGRTPRTNGDAPSVRVPNVGWDSTPRMVRADDGGRSNNRPWDAPTPRIARDASPVLDMHEWEEEQVKLDRDWYTGAEEGMLAGDEEHNPLAQFEDLALQKEKEIQAKSVKRISAKQQQYNKDNDL